MGGIFVVSEEIFQPFRFIVLTDLHVREMNGLDKLERAVARMRSESGVKFLLLLGDLMWDDEIPAFQEMMSRLGMPWYHVLGNNDRPRLREYEDQLGPLYHCVQTHGCLFLGLFNSVPMAGLEQHRGTMDPGQIAWAEQMLVHARSAGPEYQHIFLFAHAPVKENWQVEEKYWMLPELSELLLSWCRRFDITACFFGHVHREEFWTYGKTQMITTQSLNWNFDTENDLDQPFWLRERKEWGGYRVVDVDAEGIETTLRTIAWNV